MFISTYIFLPQNSRTAVQGWKFNFLFYAGSSDKSIFLDS